MLEDKKNCRIFREQNVERFERERERDVWRKVNQIERFLIFVETKKKS